MYVEPVPAKMVLFIFQFVVLLYDWNAHNMHTCTYIGEVSGTTVSNQ